MVRIERAVRIAAPAETAWQVLGDFSLAEIAGGICTRIVVEGSGIGAVRTMHIAGTWGDGYTRGAEVCVQERLESYDAAERSMTYRLVDAGPLPFADYVGSARLVRAGPDHCIAVMTSAFVPVEMDDAAAATLSRGSIDLALANLKAAAERRHAALGDVPGLTTSTADHINTGARMHTTLLDQFPREIVCRHAIRLPVDADRAWSLIGNFADMRVGSEFVDRIEFEGSGRGAVRTLHVKGGITLRERLEEYSDADRYYVYRVIDPGPLDFTHYLAMTSVQPAGPGECILMWITTATAVDGRHEEIRTLLDNNILMVFAAVRRELGIAQAA